MKWKAVVGKFPYLNVDDDYEPDPYVLLRAERRNAQLLRQHWRGASFREDALQIARLRHLCPFCLGWIERGEDVAVVAGAGVLLNQPDPSILSDGEFQLTDGTTIRVDRLYKQAHPGCAREHCRALSFTEGSDVGRTA